MAIRNLVLACAPTFLFFAMTGTASAATIITFDVPGAKQTFASDIDNQGNVVGLYFDNLDKPHGFIRFNNGTFQFYTGSDDALPHAISTEGTITGSLPQGAGRAFVGALEGTIDPFKVRGLRSAGGMAINSKGVIAGYGVDETQVMHAFLRTAKGKVRFFDAPGAGTVEGEGTETEAIGEDGTICGIVLNDNGVHGFARDKKGNVLTFDVPDSILTIATAAGKEGTVMGSYLGMDSIWHAYLRATDGSYSTFDAPGAGTQSQQGTRLNDTNRKGRIIGQVTDSNSVAHGYIRNARGKFSLFDAPGAGTVAHAGTDPIRENDSGQIVGIYTDNDLQGHSFIRLP